MTFILSANTTKHELGQEAERVWEAFGSADIHPRGRWKPNLTGKTQQYVGCYAGIIVSETSVHLILADNLLTNSTELEQRLTLLHECIHMDFALGDHRKRWLRMRARIDQDQRDIRPTAPSNTEEADREGYLERRSLAAFNFLKLPDEIVAEQFLKAAYDNWFEERAKYYVRLRQKHELMLEYPKCDESIRPFDAFYELLRCALYVPLVADVPDLEAEREELMRLERHAEECLHRYQPTELIEFLLSLRRTLLNVRFDEPLTEAEAGCEKVFERVIKA